MARFNLLGSIGVLLVTTGLSGLMPVVAEEEAATSAASAPAPAAVEAQSTLPPPATQQKKIDVKGIDPTKNWVSDRVETPVRSCPGDKCRIVKVVRPGNEITVTGYTPDGWAYITAGDVKGFILKRYLQDAPLLIAGEGKGAQDGQSAWQSAKSEIEALRKRTETAEGETGNLRKENYELKQELDYVKGLFNQTLQVNEENRRLKTEVEMLRQRNEILEQEARDGEGRDQRAWVIVGAGIILVGWILGRFARMPRRKGWNQI